MTKKNFKYLHTMIRVNNLEESIDFYSKVFEMKLLRKSDYPDGKFSLAFMGYGSEKDNTDLGNAWGHIAIGVEDIYDFCKDLENQNVNIIRKPGPMKHGKTVIAFIEDPNGYKIELIQR